ncbi:MAG: hypothetical protein PHE78_07960 [Candidatus Gastranaerophilales bacterium]|nr:hypothetical protein [Candidatus Gastranaerophilales bacterium]
MKFKQIFRVLLVIALVFCANLSSYAAFRGGADLPIRKLFYAQQVFLNNANIERLKSLYSENYKSNDGFNKDDLFKLYADTVKNHPDIKYDVVLTNIKIDGDYATVRAISKSKATTSKKSSITNDNGILSIDMETIFYLKKNGENWQIVSEQTVLERTSLLYGDCKEADIILCAPELVQSNEEYTVSLRVSPKYAKYAMGSIKKDLITYPAQNSPDIFKIFDNTGEIERIFRANNTNHNETVAASVAFASPTITKSKNLDLKISGLGVLLQRVNVLSSPSIKETEKKEDEKL